MFNCIYWNYENNLNFILAVWDNAIIGVNYADPDDLLGATMTKRRDMSFSRYPKLIYVMKYVKNKDDHIDDGWPLHQDNKEKGKAI